MHTRTNKHTYLQTHTHHAHTQTYLQTHTHSHTHADFSTQFIAIESVRSRSVRVRVPDDPRWASHTPGVIPEGSKVTPGGSPGEWEVEIEGGTDGVVLFVDGAGPPFRIEALASNKNEEHYFGYNRPMQPLH